MKAARDVLPNDGGCYRDGRASSVWTRSTSLFTALSSAGAQTPPRTFKLSTIMKKKFDKAKQSASRLIVKLNPGRRSRSRSPHSADPDPSMSTSAPSADVQRYADPKAPQTVAGTAGSIVTEFLAAARDGADLCLPLKAALVGAVKIIEICQASIYMIRKLMIQVLTFYVSARPRSAISISNSGADLRTSAPLLKRLASAAIWTRI